MPSLSQNAIDYGTREAANTTDNSSNIYQELKYTRDYLDKYGVDYGNLNQNQTIALGHAYDYAEHHGELAGSSTRSGDFGGKNGTAYSDRFGGPPTGPATPAASASYQNAGLNPLATPGQQKSAYDFAHQPIGAGAPGSTSSTFSSTSPYTIKQGDTLAALANANKTTIGALLHLNPDIKNPNIITAGHTLNLPSTAPYNPPPPEKSPIAPETLNKENGVQLPQTPEQTPHNANQTVASGGMTLLQILQNITPPTTPEDTKEKSLLDQMASLTGDLGQKAADQLTQEQSAQLPQLRSQFSDINAQIMAKMAQDKALEASYNGANTALEGQPQTLSRLQGAEAQNYKMYLAQKNNNAAAIGLLQAQAQGLQGKIADAQHTVDRAIDLKYSTEEAKLNTLKAQLEALKPSLDKEEKTQALAQNLFIKEQEQAIADKKETEKSVQGVVLDAIKAGVTDTNVLNQIGNSRTVEEALKYAAPSIGGTVSENTALEQALKQSEITKNYATARHESISANIESAPTQITTPNGSTITVPSNVAPYVSTSHTGVSYVDASTLQGTAKDKAAIVNAAQKAGLKVITNKNTASDLSNISDANNKLDTISTIMAGIDQPGWVRRALYGAGATKLAEIAQSNPQQAAAGALSSIGLDILKAISGVQGFRGNQTAIQQVTSHLPSIYDTNDVVQTKISFIRQLMTDRENGILGKSGANASNAPANTTVMTGPDGKQYHVPNDKVDAFTKAGGHK